MAAGRSGAARRALGPAGFLGALSALIVTPGSPARADEAVRTDVVEVVGEREAPPPEPTVAEDPTGFGTVIEADDFQGEAQDAAELLLRAPGVRVHHGPGGATLMLRGASADQSLVLLDGIPLNAAAGGGVDLRSLPSGLLERITVLRGNEGARYGAGALGGVALLETRAPSRELSATASLTVGSFGLAELRGSLAGGGARARGLAAIELGRSDGDYPAPFDETPSDGRADLGRVALPNNDARSGDALLKGTLELGDATELHALASGHLAERGIPGTLYQRDVHRRSERRVLSALRLAHEASAELLLDAGFEWRHDELAIWADEGAFDLAAPPSTGEAMPWQREDALSLRAGADALPLPWTRVQLQASVGAERLASPYHGGALRRERLSAAVQDELYLGSSVTVAPALRWDRVGEHDGLSPKLGVAVRPLEPLELRASVGATFRAASLGELHLEQGRVKPNPELEPERGLEVDGGVVLRLDPALVQLSAFHARIEDLILYEILAGGVSKPFNFAEASITGGELELVSEPLPWLAASASYGLALTRNLRDDPRFWGKELPYRPAHRAQARLAARAESYEGFLEGAWQSAQWANRANTIERPGAAVVRTGAGVRLASAPWALWLSGQVENLFDATVEDLLGFPQPGRAFLFTLRAVPPADNPPPKT